MFHATNIVLVNWKKEKLISFVPPKIKLKYRNTIVLQGRGYMGGRLSSCGDVDRGTTVSR